MKKIDLRLLILLVIFVTFGIPLNLHAQIGIGVEEPHPSAQLDISADGKGVLVPRMAKTNRPAAPAEGLLIYQTDDQPGFYYFTSTSWERLGASENPFTSAVPFNLIDAPNYPKGQVVTYDGSSYVTTVASPTGIPGTDTDYILIAGKGDAGSSGGGGGGAIIPFSSNDPISLTTMIGGVSGSSAALGFGNSGSVQPIGGNIDLTNGPNMAFSIPRDGSITAISGSFSSSMGLSLIGSTLTVHAQLYHAAAGSNSFAAVPGAVVTLTPYTGIIGIGAVISGTTSGLSIPVFAGSRYLLVFSCNASGLNLINTLSGYASAGVAIN